MNLTICYQPVTDKLYFSPILMSYVTSRQCLQQISAYWRSPLCEQIFRTYVERNPWTVRKQTSCYRWQNSAQPFIQLRVAYDWILYIYITVITPLLYWSKLLLVKTLLVIGQNVKSMSLSHLTPSLRVIPCEYVGEKTRVNGLRLSILTQYYMACGGLADRNAAAKTALSCAL